MSASLAQGLHSREPGGRGFKRPEDRGQDPLVVTSGALDPEGWWCCAGGLLRGSFGRPTRLAHGQFLSSGIVQPLPQEGPTSICALVTVLLLPPSAAHLRWPGKTRLCGTDPVLARAQPLPRALSG